MPGVDAHDGNRCAAETVHAFEQRAVAAVADHHRIGRLFARALSVDLSGGIRMPVSSSARGANSSLTA